MKKFNKIFFLIIFVEVIAIVILYFVPTKCGSECTEPSLLNPLGIEDGMCTLMCVIYQPGSPFYLSVDILILTIIVYFLVYLGRKLLKH